MMNFTIEITESELNVIGSELGKLPYVEVYQLVEKINKQALDQIKNNNIDPNADRTV